MELLFLVSFVLLFPNYISSRIIDESPRIIIELPKEKITEKIDNSFNYLEEKRPLIGILSQPGDGGLHLNRNTSYIAASYVKFVEVGGARAVPLIYNEPEESLKRKFSLINGIIFPGGSASLQEGPFYRSAELLYKMAIEANDKGDYFPIFGTCLGLELLSVLVTENHSVLEWFNASKIAGSLDFVNEDAKQKSMFKWFPKEVLEKIEVDKITMENHVRGISPESWLANKALSDFFEVLTTTPDKNNKVYVSTVQGRKYPITGVQWHPEKNAFEWGYLGIPHTPDAIRVTQSAASFFISEALKSSHKATWQEEDELLVYNYNPNYTGRNGKGDFDQSYIFY